MAACSQCGWTFTPDSIAANQCRKCKAALHVVSVAYLDHFEATAVDRYLAGYQEALAADPRDRDALLALGICYLRLELFREAQVTLARLVEAHPAYPLGYFYQAIATFEGVRPGRSTFATVQRAERLLTAASGMEGADGRYDLALADIRDDYYVANDLRCPEPDPDTLRAAAAQKRVDADERTRTLALLGLAAAPAPAPEAVAPVTAPDRRGIRHWFFVQPARFPMWSLLAAAVLAIAAVGVALGVAVAAGPLSAELTDNTADADAVFALFTVGSVAAAVVVALCVLVFVAVRLLGYLRSRGRYRRRPSDAQLDGWVEADLASLDEASLRKANLERADLVGDAVRIVGLPQTTAGARWASRAGSDRLVRYTPMAVTIVHFGRDQLVRSTCTWDLLGGRAVAEEHEETFYRDVVSVTTRPTSRRVRLGGRWLQLDDAETFELTTSAGTTVSVVLDAPALSRSLRGRLRDFTRAEASVKAIRKMLREKKA